MGVKQPLEVAKLKGSDKRNPQRYRGEVPKNKKPLAQAPAHLTSKAKKTWLELKKLALPNVLTASDGILFEVLANLLVEYRSDPEGFTSAKYSSLIGCLSKLGMSPSDRQKLALAVAPKPGDNEFDEF